MTKLAHSVSIVETAMDRVVVATRWSRSAALANGLASVSLGGLGAWRGLMLARFPPNPPARPRRIDWCWNGVGSGPDAATGAESSSAFVAGVAPRASSRQLAFAARMMTLVTA